MNLQNLLLVGCIAALGRLNAQTTDRRPAFQNRCSGCHGTDGNGGEHGPSILAAVQSRNDQELRTFLHDGVPARGMPAFNTVPDPEMAALVSFLRTLVPAGRGGGRGRGAPARMTLQVDGKKLEGVALAQAGWAADLR